MVNREEPTADTADLDSAVQIFTAVKGRLFGIAYRMLGTVADAEDIVQEVWLRWQRCDRSAVREPAAFLATTATRLSINVSQSARARHETYVGPWLPEPVDTSADPLLGAERGEVLSLAVLMLLEKLTPTERAAYVLREAFAYSYAQIAEVVQLTDAAARQLVSHARKHLSSERRKTVAASEQRRLLEAFLSAAQSGNVEQLEQLFAEDIVSLSDGGGKNKLAARIPVMGRERVAKFVAAFSSHFWRDTELIWGEVNGQPVVKIKHSGELTTVLAANASADGIRRLMWLMNPEKLERLPRAE